MGRLVMILQEIYLDKYKWGVLIFYAVDSIFTDIIMSEIEELDCSKEEMSSAKKLLMSNKYNTGLTISNFDKRESVVVIGLTDSAEEFNNTYDHEKGHLAMHICSAYSIDPFSEEYQYLAGEIAKLTFPVAQHFLCEECRNKLFLI